MKPTGVRIDQSIVPTIATIGMTLKSANLIKAWKLKEFNRRKDKEVMENNNKPVPVQAMPIVGVVPVIFGDCGQGKLTQPPWHTHTIHL